MIKSPSLFTRLLVVIYDVLLLAGVVFASHAIIFFALKLLPISIGDSIIIKVLHFACLIIISILFYGWFWVNGGQTLGMKAWHLYLINDSSGKFINWQLAVQRYFLAAISWLPLGMGFFWILLHKENKTWHDMLTNTRIVKYRDHK